MKVGLLSFLLFFTGQVMAFNGIQIVGVSESKKSVIVDRGSLEGVKTGDKARFLIQKGIANPKITYVARGEAIKVHSNYSYWYLSYVENPFLIRRGSKLLMSLQSEVLEGSRRYNIKQKKSILSDGKSFAPFLLDRENIPRELVFSEKNYEPSEIIVDTYSKKEQDIETTNFDNWVRRKDPEFVEEYLDEYPLKHVNRANQVVPADKVRRNYKQAEFDGSLKESVDKVNGLRYGLAPMYHEQKKDSLGVREKITTDNYYQRLVQDKKGENFISPRAVAKIRKEGPGWSADMNDEQLRRFYNRSGIERELVRQKEAQGEKAGHELNFRYATGLNQNTTQADDNHQSTNYSLAIGYELMLIRTNPALKNFTVEMALERGINFYDLDGINGRFVEGTAGFAANWYFYNPPTSIRQYMFFLGVGTKRGSASVTSTSITKDYTYSVVALPVLRFGMKYRFKAGDTQDESVKIGMGVNFLFETESVRLSVEDALNDDIAPVITAQNVKFAVGMSFYF
ncbi:MAG: hypothetical protein HN509_06200 [Halobacteriovoraceae bacterium]|nr:hypothetical protein [Halobacteriovoraceae bacterium]